VLDGYSYMSRFSLISDVDMPTCEGFLRELIIGLRVFRLAQNTWDYLT
jgi:hypothetical protein